MSRFYDNNASAGEARAKLAATPQMARRIAPDKSKDIPEFKCPKKWSKPA